MSILAFTPLSALCRGPFCSCDRLCICFPLGKGGIDVGCLDRQKHRIRTRRIYRRLLSSAAVLSTLAFTPLLALCHGPFCCCYFLCICFPLGTGGIYVGCLNRRVYIQEEKSYCTWARAAKPLEPPAQICSLLGCSKGGRSFCRPFPLATHAIQQHTSMR